MTVLAIVQARLGSKRLPGKVLCEIQGLPVVSWISQRLSEAKTIDQVVFAIPEVDANTDLTQLLDSLGEKWATGSEIDVLERYLDVAVKFKADDIVRITGDCPFVDPVLVDACVSKYLTENLDYCSNVDPATFPDGLDVEVFSVNQLLWSAKHSRLPEEREHVTLGIRERSGIRKGNIALAVDKSAHRVTLDTKEDLLTLNMIANFFAPRMSFSTDEIVKFCDAFPEKLQNTDLTRNYGQKIGSGQKLWERAKRVIPGGNMLLSKRAEMLLPEKWPAYFSRTNGCKVWDLDGLPLIDMSLMGVGTNILGYNCPTVDAAVIKIVQSGNLSTLNCPEEVYLAEKLVELHPWAEMVRLARTGGEANAIAVRIARSASGRDGVAVCGYHGWHDWYLAANLGPEDELDAHLLPGLRIDGVPKTLRNTVHPFQYGDLDAFCQILNNEKIGVVKMEVQRTHQADLPFLRQIRELTTKRGIVLIFDECTSGFRQSFGGLHLLYDIKPDLCVLGKTLGNGYAITAVLGTKAVMECAQNSFISSTFWTERIGPSAAIATLSEMERTQAWQRITATGAAIKKIWRELAEQNKLEITISGLDALATFSFHSQSEIYKTFITQEMLKQGFLATNAVYASLVHTKNIISSYQEALAEVFYVIGKDSDPQRIGRLLESPVCHTSFKRLN